MNLPFDDDSCGWFRALPDVLEPVELTQQLDADVVVIGAGFTGLSAARQMARNRPDASVVLIDAQQVGYGASGRNSGFAIDLPHKFALENPDKEFKKRILRLNKAGIRILNDQVNEHNIDCQWSAAGKYQAAVGERGRRYLEQFGRLLDELDEPYSWCSREDLGAILGTEFYSQAIFTSGGYLMQPAALTQGLARALPANVQLFTNSPVLSLEPLTTGGHRVQTPRGSLRAGQVILATSIYTREFGFLKNRLLPITTFASMTRPLTAREQAQYHGQYDWGVTPADHAGTTLRMTRDKRLMVRNTYHYSALYGRSVSARHRNKIAAIHRQSLAARYPQFSRLPFEYTWGGTYAISRNFTNYFGLLAPGVFAAACDNGVGVVWGTIAGSLIADLASNHSSALLEDIQAVTGLPSLNPPEPVSSWGAKARIVLARMASRSEL